MAQWIHPVNIEYNVYDPLNHEHWLVDQTDADHIKTNSPYILYWKVDYNATELQNDELSNLYQESNQLVFYDSEPARVYMYADIAPIINELTRLGENTIKEGTFFCNKTDIFSILDRLPSSGDLFCVYYFNIDRTHSKTFYTIASVSDSDLHLYRYLHLVINAEQTNLSNIPKDIFDYQIKEF
jgi:hypothetical protein